jgi:hypothetical protein
MLSGAVEKRSRWKKQRAEKAAEQPKKALFIVGGRIL